MSDLRPIDEVRFICDALGDLAEQVREHCPVLHSEVERSLALADYALELVQILARIRDVNLMNEQGVEG